MHTLCALFFVFILQNAKTKKVVTVVTTLFYAVFLSALPNRKPGSVVDDHLSCLYIAVKLFATMGIYAEQAQLMLSRKVLLRIGFTRHTVSPSCR